MINVTLWMEMVDLIAYKVILFQKQLKSGFASFVKCDLSLFALFY